jgi:ribulose-bisphosphate carboxylase large chain
MSWIEVTYRARCAPEDAAVIADAIALEQSVEVPRTVVRDAFIADQIVGRVDGIRNNGDGTHAIRIRLASATTGYDVAQSLNMLFGNSSLHDHVELIDADFPPDFLARFPGPRFGLEGIRALVVIKDDHGLADQRYAPFAQRVAACQRALERAARETGTRALYAPSLVGSPATIEGQARIARDAGAGMLLAAPALVGMPAFAELVSNHPDVPFLAHPGFGGATRMAHAFLLGKWYRLLGADASIFPNFGGRFAFSKPVCADIARNCLAPWGHLRRTVPVAGGGVLVERTHELVDFYGNDVMLLIGGSLLEAGDRLLQRTQAFVAAVHDAARAPEVDRALPA